MGRGAKIKRTKIKGSENSRQAKFEGTKVFSSNSYRSKMVKRYFTHQNDSFND